MQAWKGEIYFSLKIETTSWNLKAHAQKLVDLSPVMDELFNLSEDRKILVESWGELWVEFLVKKKSHEMGFQHGRYRFNLGNPLRETKNNKSMEHVRKLPAGRPEKTPTDSVGCCCCCRANTRTCCPPPPPPTLYRVSYRVSSRCRSFRLPNEKLPWPCCLLIFDATAVLHRGRVSFVRHRNFLFFYISWFE